MCNLSFLNWNCERLCTYECMCLKQEVYKTAKQTLQIFIQINRRVQLQGYYSLAIVLARKTFGPDTSHIVFNYHLADPWLELPSMFGAWWSLEPNASRTTCSWAREWWRARSLTRTSNMCHQGRWRDWRPRKISSSLATGIQPCATCWWPAATMGSRSFSGDRSRRQIASTARRCRWKQWSLSWLPTWKLALIGTSPWSASKPGWQRRASVWKPTDGCCHLRIGSIQGRFKTLCNITSRIPMDQTLSGDSLAGPWTSCRRWLPFGSLAAKRWRQRWGCGARWCHLACACTTPLTWTCDGFELPAKDGLAAAFCQIKLCSAKKNRHLATSTKRAVVSAHMSRVVVSTHSGMPIYASVFASPPCLTWEKNSSKQASLTVDSKQMFKQYLPWQLSQNNPKMLDVKAARILAVMLAWTSCEYSFSAGATASCHSAEMKRDAWCQDFA